MAKDDKAQSVEALAVRSDGALIDDSGQVKTMPSSTARAMAKRRWEKVEAVASMAVIEELGAKSRGEALARVLKLAFPIAQDSGNRQSMRAIAFLWEKLAGDVMLQAVHEEVGTEDTQRLVPPLTVVFEGMTHEDRMTLAHRLVSRIEEAGDES